MRDELLYYYERELTFLRRMGAEFAQAYPKVASRLQIEPSKCEDPHVERMLEAFAFLAARVHLKLDDDFSEISDALLSIVYPHYIRPIPSMTLVEFELDPEQGKVMTGVRIPRGSQLLSRPVAGTPCKFRTVYDTTLWPIKVSAVQWTTPDRLRPPIKAPDAIAVLRIELTCFPDVSLSKLALDTLRFHVAGDSSTVYSLYELLGNNCVRIVARDPNAKAGSRSITLPSDALTPAGFADEDGMLPYPRRSFVGYRMLQEYFTFPEKFLFFDLAGLSQLRAAGFGDKVELILFISPFERADRRPMLEAGISERSIRLGCTPAVNLFPQTSEPILLTQRQHEYLLVPDARRRQSVSVFSVDDVLGVSPGASTPERFEPFYSYRHATSGTTPQQFWHAVRRTAGWRPDGGSDVYLSFVDLSSAPVEPDVDAVTARLTCYNADLPSRLPFGSESGDFELDGGGPIKRITAIVKPTSVVEPPLGQPQLWRLISQLSLNYLSLIEGGAEALREILRLHNFADSAAAEKQIQGLVSVAGSPAYSRVSSAHGLSFARGTRVDVTLDEEQFTGGGAFLFATVLERFLGLYASINSFSILAARTGQRKDVMRVWPPRAGWKTLL
ncbi:MAG TPA: type VI secretion system baseplate subunit TssF [Gemmatimonadaceae bacterium]|nr:type VI secretion system baseplate subunit TssF [Gemmatimonadaceae bacterium]